VPLGRITSKRRALPQLRFSGGYYRSQRSCPGGSTVPTERREESDNWTAWKGTQFTASENHPIWRRRPQGLKAVYGDVGGYFRSQKQFLETDYIPTQDWTTVYYDPSTLCTTTTRKRAPILPTTPGNMPLPPIDDLSDSELDVLGATAIARCKPTNSMADMSVFLGELMQGVPRLPLELLRDRTQKMRKRGSNEYLNAQFGWLPMARDAEKFLRAVSQASTALDQYERDAGRVVRRRYSFPPEVSREVKTVLTGVSAYTPGTTGGVMYDTAARNLGKVIRVRETTRTVWFSGAFTYYLPSGYDASNAMHRHALLANKIFGLELTPETLWNLTPWSWAVDWFSNAGDVISNLTDWATDGLVLKYGYVMAHTVTRDTYTYEGPTGYRNKDLRPTPIVVTSEVKQRRKANPFGFGVTWGGLTPRQLSIAAALGLANR